MLGDKKEYQSDCEYFDIMIEELDRANKIISEYLGMAKNKIVNLRSQSIDRGIESLYPLIQSEANLREMRVLLDLHDSPEVHLDENEMRQLLLNMCRNAMEAMSFRGTLTIGTRQEGNEVILYIKDEGSGLSSEIIDKIGTPFLTTKENGTGLGLAVCYSIAARHNARIDYETGPSGTHVLCAVSDQWRTKRSTQIASLMGWARNTISMKSSPGTLFLCTSGMITSCSGRFKTGCKVPLPRLLTLPIAGRRSISFLAWSQVIRFCLSRNRMVRS